MGYEAVDRALKAGGIVLLDGAIGTELQRRCVAMDPTAWCGAVSAENRAVLEAIHADYIAAGAQILTANTFATSRLVLSRAGLGGRFEEINRTVIDAARAVRDASGWDDLVIAGSLSHMVPRHDLHGDVDDAEIADAYAELAAFLAGQGCEMILLEMMFAPERMVHAFRAATATGLPVWAGFSARRGPDERVLSFARDREIAFTEIVSILGDFDVAAAGVMHSECEVICDAIDIVRGVYDGPLTAYPDSGYMKMPNWQFEDIIPVKEFVACAERWVGQGVQVIGGCCGLGPEHIAALRPLRERSVSPP